MVDHFTLTKHIQTSNRFHRRREIFKWLHRVATHRNCRSRIKAIARDKLVEIERDGHWPESERNMKEKRVTRTR